MSRKSCRSVCQTNRCQIHRCPTPAVSAPRQVAHATVKPSSRRGFAYYGPAPAAIAVLALLAGVFIAFSKQEAQKQQPDLILVTFAKEHIEAYQRAASHFQAKTGKRVDIQLTEQRALYARLGAAMQAGASVPDLVEVLDGNMAPFIRGPIADVGFVDLTPRLRAEGWLDKLVPSRVSMWSSRGHVFGIPHDVHPTMLAYRRDLIEQEGIDVSKLTTWEEFARVGREIAQKHRRPDGVTSDRYMMDLAPGGLQLVPLLLQRGVNVLDEQGKVAFDVPETVEVIDWYIRAAVDGPRQDADGTPRRSQRIGFEAGWGQNLSKTLTDGTVLFILCPDWRCTTFRQDIPNLSGKMSLMPLPAWTEGTRRTSVWGGTCLSLPKAGKNVQLAWDFARFLYLNLDELQDRYRNSSILPPLPDAWKFPELDQPDPYFSGLHRGRLFADLAPSTPPRYVNPFNNLAEGKLNEAFVNSVTYYQRNGEKGLQAYITSELMRTAEQVRAQMRRNVFLRENESGSPPSNPETR